MYRYTCINYSNLILNINDLFIFQISENIAKLLQLLSLKLTYKRIHKKSKNPVLNVSTRNEKEFLSDFNR